MLVEIEDDHRQVIVFAQADCCSVHNLQATLDDFHVGDLLGHGRVLHQEGIGIVDAIDFGGLQDYFCFDLHCPERGGGVGREVGIAGSGSKDHNPLFLEMANRAASNERLRDLVHLDGCHHASVDGSFFKRVLQSQGVDHGGEHTHMV